MIEEDYLDLPGWKTRRRRKDDNGDYHIQAEITIPFDSCPNCGTAVKRHDKRERFLVDLPVYESRVGIHYDHVRYKCESCKKILRHPLPGCNDRRRMTQRLAEFIAKETLKSNYARVGREVGVVENTVRNVFLDWLNKQDEVHRPDTPSVLGIDEIYLNGYLCVFTDIRKPGVVDMLKDLKLPTVRTGLMKLDADKVKIATMDLRKTYREAVKWILPRALIVIDKFHVVKALYDCVSTIRKSEQNANPRRRVMLKNDRHLLYKDDAKLDAMEMMRRETMFDNHPILRKAVKARDEFRLLYKCSSRREAEYYYDEWEGSLSDELRLGFKSLTDNFKDHDIRRSILNYFDTDQVTNAYTESVNRLIRLIYLAGRNYDFERLRAKVIYITGIKVVKKPVIKRNYTFDHMSGIDRDYDPDDYDPYNYYCNAGIAELIEMFESEVLQEKYTFSDDEKTDDFLFRENYSQ